jgi:uncharacterized protein YndB with AHSA1/START domain
VSQIDETVSERSTAHATFVIERTYDVPPQRIFRAWADPDAKRHWFGPPQLPVGAYSLDFQEGGREHMSINMPDGGAYSFDALYQDIVPAQRIVYTYDMHHDRQRISVSVATIEFHAAGEGTQLTVTEQGVYLDGLDTSAQREHGTNALMDALGTYVQGGHEGA